MSATVTTTKSTITPNKPASVTQTVKGTTPKGNLKILLFEDEVGLSAYYPLNYSPTLFFSTQVIQLLCRRLSLLLLFSLLFLLK